MEAPAGSNAVVGGEDLAIVARQIGREPQAMSRIVAVCPWGCPAVVECLPADREGRPFPTLYYCTCPTLVAAVSRLEGTGGVRRWTRQLLDSSVLSASVEAAAKASVRRRVALLDEHGLHVVSGRSLAGGVAGVADPLAVKCLHAHVAHAFACPGYAFGEAVIAELEAFWCTDRRCAEVGGGDS
ncbi:MAG: DUF501 domain-containing protein [Thermoleophilia bacterium]